MLHGYAANAITARIAKTCLHRLCLACGVFTSTTIDVKDQSALDCIQASDGMQRGNSAPNRASRPRSKSHANCIHRVKLNLRMYLAFPNRKNRDSRLGNCPHRKMGQAQLYSRNSAVVAVVAVVECNSSHIRRL